jgi:exosortase
MNVTNMTTGLNSGGQPSPSSLQGRLQAALPQMLPILIGACVLAWAYWPNLENLCTTWLREPNYSHGILVVPAAICIFLLRMVEREEIPVAQQGPWWSWLVLVAILGARGLAYEMGTQWLESSTLIPAVGALILILGGWPILERAWPAVLYLFFMLPLPKAANEMIAMPLQQIATLGSVFFMQLTGLRTLAEGNIIVLPDAPTGIQTLEVARACNGLSMLMTLAATVTATVILFPLPTWKRVVVLASAIPIALLSNLIRIVATGWGYYLLEGERAKHFAHDGSGYMMMPLALILVLLELLLLSWLDPDDELVKKEPAKPVLAMIPHKTTDKPKA